MGISELIKFKHPEKYYKLKLIGRKLLNIVSQLKIRLNFKLEKTSDSFLIDV
jgi:hypothetical protein